MCPILLGPIRHRIEFSLQGLLDLHTAHRPGVCAPYAPGSQNGNKHKAVWDKEYQRASRRRGWPDCSRPALSRHPGGCHGRKEKSGEKTLGQPAGFLEEVRPSALAGSHYGNHNPKMVSNGLGWPRPSAGHARTAPDDRRGPQRATLLWTDSVV